MANLAKKIVNKTRGSPKKHVEEQLEVIHYIHDLTGETEKYHQLLAEPNTSSDEEELLNTTLHNP